MSEPEETLDEKDSFCKCFSLRILRVNMLSVYVRIIRGSSVLRYAGDL